MHSFTSQDAAIVLVLVHVIWRANLSKCYLPGFWRNRKIWKRHVHPFCRSSVDMKPQLTIQHDIAALWPQCSTAWAELKHQCSLRGRRAQARDSSDAHAPWSPDTRRGIRPFGRVPPELVYLQGSWCIIQVTHSAASSLQMSYIYRAIDTVGESSVKFWGHTIVWSAQWIPAVVNVGFINRSR
jgi:hypothetical protein